jgi:hypothetical protein
MATHVKKEIQFQRDALHEICHELGLTVTDDIINRDCVVKKGNIYLFRAVFHPKKDYFGVRFALGQTSVYKYTKETVIELVERLIERRGNRKVTITSDYSKENHII